MGQTTSRICISRSYSLELSTRLISLPKATNWIWWPTSHNSHKIDEDHTLGRACSLAREKINHSKCITTSEIQSIAKWRKEALISDHYSSNLIDFSQIRAIPVKLESNHTYSLQRAYWYSHSVSMFCNRKSQSKILVRAQLFHTSAGFCWFFLPLNDGVISNSHLCLS